jgi:paraquat-inducible protein B
MRNLILTLIIWIICFTAITASVSLTYSWYKNRGTDIHIHFKDVDGLIPNHSKIMYLGVQIGKITNIVLDIETGYPKVIARVSKQMMQTLGEDSNFWMVQPKLGLDSIRNLETIASGNYITVEPVPGNFKNEFIALENNPIDIKFRLGLCLTLKADSAAGIEAGSEILYHDVAIGQVGSIKLADDKESVLIVAHIEKEYKSVITKDSFFGNISGFHASINLLSGSEISMHSFKSLVKGAIKVITPDLKAPKVKNHHVFNLLKAAEFKALTEK